MTDNPNEYAASSMSSRPRLTIAHFRRAFGAPSETFIADPIERLAKRGVLNRVFTLLSLDSGSPVEHVPMVKATGTRGRSIEQRSRRMPAVFSKLDFLAWPLARQWLAYQLKKSAPDVLISHFGPDGCFAAPVARRLRIPHIVFFYGYDVNLLEMSSRNVWALLYPRLFRNANLLCTTSNYLARRLIELGAPPSKQAVIHVGIDVDFFEWSEPVDRFDGRVVRLLHVGRLTAKKSPLKLLRAVREAQHLCSELRLELTIAGDGELAGEARALAVALGLTHQVRFAGRVARERVKELLQTHHLYTQYCETTPSGDTEGLGVSFIEASAVGLPIVTTNHNGLPEVVLDGVSGLLSEEGDTSAMAKNIAILARGSHRWSSMGRAGRDHVKRYFSIERQVDRLLDTCLAQAAHGARSMGQNS